MKTTSEQWLAAAEDDLRVIARIAADPRLTHMVAFHCQQCIEKTLKAVIEEYAMGHVRIHNLIRLFQAAGFFRVESCPALAVLPLVGLAANTIIRVQYV